MEDVREKLLAELNERIKFDNWYSWWHLYFASTWSAIAVFGSFGAAIVAALDLFPSWGVAILAAIPGFVIGVFQRFSYYRRSRWHCIMETQVKALVRAMEYENADPSAISKRFSALMLRMEPLYPGSGLDGVSDLSNEKI
jgi:hypothetical protein